MLVRGCCDQRRRLPVAVERERPDVALAAAAESEKQSSSVGCPCFGPVVDARLRLRQLFRGAATGQLPEYAATVFTRGFVRDAASIGRPDRRDVLPGKREPP